MFDKLKNFFTRDKTDYKTLYEQAQAESQHWEYKYNKLHRIIKEAVENS